MKTVCSFLAKSAGPIVATLSCYDRLIFKGYLPFGGGKHLNAFVDGRLRIPRKDSLPEVQRMSQQLAEHAQQMAAEASAPYRYLQGKHDKKRLIDRIARDRGHPEGLLAVLCFQKTCRTVKLRWGRKRPRLAESRRVNGRSYAGFNPPRVEDVRLFAAVLRGEHLLAGFRNAGIRRLLYGDSSCRLERRRHSASVGGKLKRLHV